MSKTGSDVINVFTFSNALLHPIVQTHFRVFSHNPRNGLVSGRKVW